MSIFDSTLVRRPKRSKFDLSFDNKMSVNFGWINPTLCLEAVPSDKFFHRHQLFTEMAPLNSMVMHRFDIRTEYFFVPTRLIYEDFEKFIVGGDDGETDYVPPCITIEAALHAYPDFLKAGGLPDLLGIPAGQGNNEYFKKQKISLLPFLAYQFIYNEFYRDQNLIPEIQLDFRGGDYSLQAMAADPDDQTNYFYQLFSLRRRAYPKDYFTSCLPAPQAGNPVRIPQSGGLAVGLFDADGNPMVAESEQTYPIGVGPDGNILRARSQTNQNTIPILDGTEVRTISESDGTIDELRTAIRIQEWKERHARGGGRFKETIANHFGTTVPDYRLNRPEYIAGTKDVYSLGNLYSTDFSDDVNGIVQGYPVSKAVGAGISKGFRYKCREHGYLIGFITMYPKAAYYQGLHRSWQRFDKFEYYWPEFANLGEQAVKSKELFANSQLTFDNDEGIVDEAVFGYQSRYAEYKSHHDEVHGDFRTASMEHYHDGRKFTSEPTLSKNFIEVNPSVDHTNRIFNDTLEYNSHILLDIYHNIKAVRPMPRYGIPTI